MQALQHVYPNYKWLFWRFTGSTHLGFWQKQENRQEFFDWLGTQLGCEDMDDWYNVTQEDIHKYGGHGLLSTYYNDSPSKAIQEVYPEHSWTPWRFAKAPSGLWNSSHNQREFF